MKITDKSWKVICANVTEKKQYLDYAKKCGLDFLTVCYNDQDLVLAIGDDGMIFSYHTYVEFIGEKDLLTPTGFRTLCDEHAGWSGTLAVPEFVPEQPLPMDVLHGLNLIHDERQHQVLSRRSTVLGDDRYTHEELHSFARYWLTTQYDTGTRAAIEAELTGKWGWDHVAFQYAAKSIEQRLSIAGALIAAELDRLHRLSLKK